MHQQEMIQNSIQNKKNADAGLFDGLMHPGECIQIPNTRPVFYIIWDSSW